MDRQQIQQYSLYLAPNASTYTTLKYYSIKRIEDAGAYTNNADVLLDFYLVCVAGLAYYLSQKRPR